MDWSLILVILAVVFLVGHLVLDLRGMLSKMRDLQHSYDRYATSFMCSACRTINRDKKTLLHETMWTAAAIIVLAVHITLDFVA